MTPAELTELDRMLAEKVMNLEVGHFGLKGELAVIIPDWKERGLRNNILIWHPTSDIAQAFMVAKKLRISVLALNDGNWQARFYASMRHSEKADTPELSICLCAKSWLDAQPSAPSEAKGIQIGIGSNEMKTFTGEEVKQSVVAAGITRIEHHKCSFCGYMVSYLVEGEHLYFDSGCDCVRGSIPPIPRTWQEAADWINMQTREDIKEKLAARFGLTHQPQI